MNQPQTEALQTLQLIDSSDGVAIEAAYKKTVVRLEQLTARGALRYYRQELLLRARRAYLQLQSKDNSTTTSFDGAHTLNRSEKEPYSEQQRSSSIVARQAAKWHKNVNPQVPVRFDESKQWFGGMARQEDKSKKPASAKIDLRQFSQAMHLQGRSLDYLRKRLQPNETAEVTAPQVRQSPPPNAVGRQGILLHRLEGQGDHLRAGRTPHEHALVEDQFCAAVLLRLEGNLIRYDCRRELLLMAASMQIGKFRANFLMAQIVEAVRSNEHVGICASKPQKHASIQAALPEKESPPLPITADKKEGQSERWTKLHLALVMGLAGAAAILIDWLIIHYLAAQ